MSVPLKMLYDFVLIFALLLIIYLVFINKNRKEYSKLKDNSVIKNFIAKYNLDMRKTKYKNVLITLSIINSFILAFTTVLILNLNVSYWKYPIAFVVIVSLIYSLYEITGRYFKKKEDERNV
ncbi:MAG: hypothetical protein IJK67_00065 [Bacilli bacterium]|nr:hypothetical protein [Bacilli bacterium]